MTLTAIDWAVIIGYFVVVLAIGMAFYRRAGTSVDQYFLSGRSLPWWLAGTSMVATTFAADTPLAVAGIVGLLPAMLLFLIGYMRFEGGESWPTTLAIALLTWIVAYVLFHKILIIPWPQALLGDWLGFLRSSNWFNLM